jgi:hypothetical protein
MPLRRTDEPSILEALSSSPSCPQNSGNVSRYKGKISPSIVRMFHAAQADAEGSQGGASSPSEISRRKSGSEFGETGGDGLRPSPVSQTRLLSPVSLLCLPMGPPRIRMHFHPKCIQNGKFHGSPSTPRTPAFPLLLLSQRTLYARAVVLSTIRFRSKGTCRGGGCLCARGLTQGHGARRSF